MEQKILIVDDEAHIRMLIEQTLEELEDDGVEFLTAENGEIALEIISKRKSKAGVFRCDDAQNEWHGSMPSRKERAGTQRCLYRIAYSKRTGIRSAKRPGSWRGCIHDKAF